MRVHDASVMVGYDASESARWAVVWAAEEALQRDRRLTVVSAVDYAGLGLRGPASMAHLWLRDAREQVALMAWEGAELARARAAGLEVRPVGKVGRPCRVLDEESSIAHLLVVGTRARSALAEAALGSVAESVVTMAHCSVVLVRAGRMPHPGPHHPVVVGVDGSLAALSAVDVAAGIADTAGAALIVIAAWMPSSTRARGPSRAASNHDPELRAPSGAREAVQAAVARAHTAHPCLDLRGTEVEGPPTAVLPAQSGQAGLLVVGSRGRAAVPALLLGSVSRAVARSAPCAVAVVGPHAVASASAAQPAKDESPLQASAS